MIKYALCFLFIFHYSIALGATNDSVKVIALQSMNSQIITLDEGKFYKAGDHQFNTLWTRDFTYSIESLLYFRYDQVVHDHLDFLLNNLDKNGLVPLYADSIGPMTRVLRSTLQILFPEISPLKLKSPLKAYYNVAGKYPVIDSNALVIIGTSLYIKKTNDLNFLYKHRDHLRSAFNYYQSKLSNNGLIFQDPYSDWQDSAKRKGEIFLTQLLYWKAATALGELLNENLIDTEAFKFKVKNYFFSQQIGLFIIDPASKIERRALEDQLLAIHWNFVKNTEAMNLYQTLKKDLLWTISGPGRASYPSYKKHEINWYVKISGAREYHGSLHWSWLWGLTGTVALELNDLDTVDQLKEKIDEVLLRDKVVGEVYFPNDTFKLFRSNLYRSERPFGWGSAFISYFLFQL